MEISETPENINQNPKRTELINLQKKQNSGETWTDQDRLRLLELINEVDIPVHIPKEEQKSLLHRQTLAGVSGHPPLSENEKTKLQQIHGLH
jgi:hypothetical protein